MKFIVYCEKAEDLAYAEKAVKGAISDDANLARGIAFTHMDGRSSLVRRLPSGTIAVNVWSFSGAEVEASA